MSQANADKRTRSDVDRVSSAYRTASLKSPLGLLSTTIDTVNASASRPNVLSNSMKAFTSPLWLLTISSLRCVWLAASEMRRSPSVSGLNKLLDHCFLRRPSRELPHNEDDWPVRSGNQTSMGY